MEPTTVETYEALASLVDVQLLDPNLSLEDVDRACRTAREYGVRAVVVRPCDAELVLQWMSGSGITVASTAGYPHGYSRTGTKLYEARDLLRLGVREIDFVLNAAAVLSRQFRHVETELQQISESCRSLGARLNVIYNSRLLGEDHKIISTKICRRVEVHAIGVDESDSAFYQPLLKDTLRLKLQAPVLTVEEALAARAAGFSSLPAADPRALLDCWRAQLTAPPSPS
jgi:deoxyribose-phosphate aldolase